MFKSTPFQLSRIYASGWTAGRKCATADVAEIDAVADRLNPYLPLTERERWSRGFKDAVSRVQGTPAKFRGRPIPAGE